MPIGTAYHDWDAELPADNLALLLHTDYSDKFHFLIMKTRSARAREIEQSLMSDHPEEVIFDKIGVGDAVVVAEMHSSFGYRYIFASCYYYSNGGLQL